jgi:hypothetical protein
MPAGKSGARQALTRIHAVEWGALAPSPTTPVVSHTLPFGEVIPRGSDRRGRRSAHARARVLPNSNRMKVLESVWIDRGASPCIRWPAKAAEDCRSPRRCARPWGRSNIRQVLDCGSPLPLSWMCNYCSVLAAASLLYDFRVSTPRGVVSGCPVGRNCGAAATSAGSGPCPPPRSSCRQWSPRPGPRLGPV